MRRDYFLIEHPNIEDAEFRRSLRALVEAHSNRVDTTKLRYFGIYVFEKTDGLVETLHSLGGLNESAAKRWVVAGATWHDGDLAEYHLVEDGEVVYDMRGDGPIDPRLRSSFDY